MFRAFLLALTILGTPLQAEQYKPQFQSTIICRSETNIWLLLHMWQHHGYEGFEKTRSFLFERQKCVGRHIPEISEASLLHAREHMPLKHNWEMTVYVSSAVNWYGRKLHVISNLPLAAPVRRFILELSIDTTEE